MSPKVLAIDYGRVRSGVAVSDPSGSIARPIGVVRDAGSEAGLDQLVQLVLDEQAEQVVVGMPFTLKGEHGAQARETDEFVELLRARLDVPVETYDERFTTTLGGEDDRAAAHLLESFLHAKGARS
jgi:putative holliday junction resolvase